MIEPTITPRERVPLPLPNENAYASWIALSRVKGLGCASFKRLAAHFSDPTVAFAASGSDLREVPGLEADAIEGLLSFSQWEEAQEEVQRAKMAGVDIIPYSAANYPSRLRMIPDPPPFLYAKGGILEQDNSAIAVVGSRSASDYGCRVARDLARDLATLGFTVVSGMARGIDGAAHGTALDAGGRTIAVLGSGADIVYPPEHERLYQRIGENGAVLSELPLGSRPLAFNFPTRNRLISGLSMGVVVVEATEKSGSLITAALALDQGREVFAVPGEAGASRSRGTHRLIRQGAKLVESVQDIFEEIAPQLLPRAAEARQGTTPALPAGASLEVRRIFEICSERSLQIDEVIQTSGLSTSKVSEILLELELQGYLRQLPGKRYTAER